jgi:hypothetical protein
MTRFSIVKVPDQGKTAALDRLATARMSKSPMVKAGRVRAAAPSRRVLHASFTPQTNLN